jgi:hypothetical protein
MQSSLGRANVIDIGLNRIEGLFARLDPSPMVERDLDDAVEEFLVDCALDEPDGTSLTIRIHLPAPDPSAEAEALTAATRNYFGFMRDREAARVKRLFAEGRQALAAGLLFLALCTALGQAAYRVFGGAPGAFLREGLSIIGWVANWRPVEIFLYDWRPMRRKEKVYGRLAEASVEVCIDNAG